MTPKGNLELLTNKLSKKFSNETRNNSMICPNSIEQFSPEDVFTLYEQFDSEKWALKALGMLIADADLEMFSGRRQGDSDELRWGLQQLLALCVKSQEEHITAIYAKARNSAEHIIVTALKISKAEPQARIKEVLQEVELVLTQFGANEYPKAVHAKKFLLDLLDMTSCDKADFKQEATGT